MGRKKIYRTRTRWKEESLVGIDLTTGSRDSPILIQLIGSYQIVYFIEENISLEQSS